MKTFNMVVLYLMLTILATRAQTASDTASQTGTVTTVPVPTEYHVTDQGAYYRVWQRETYATDADGQVVTNIHKYTELASGLNHLVKGKWVESTEEIVILPDGGAAATNGQHQAYFPGDIYNGVIRMVTPDGKILESRPMGMSYDDGTNTIMIAELTNSVGYVVDSNVVIYPDAFTGFKADLCYTYTKAGFEQDVILRQQPPTPESLGLNADTAKLQLLTEFFSPPQPTIQASALPVQAGLALEDQSLDFGTMQMIRGRAFLLGQEVANTGVWVGKQWVELDGRQFLVEEVPVNAIAEGLAELPLTAMNSGPGKAVHMASRHRALPAHRLAQTVPGTQLMQMAQNTQPTKGLVMDYQIINGSLTNFTFQGDSTYYITNAVNLTGTTTIEGGCVIKYGLYQEYGPDPILTCSGPIICKTSAYRPAILTAINDNSVGETISGSTGWPGGNYYGDGYLNCSGANIVLDHLRFLYAEDGIGFSGGTNNILRNSQFYYCPYAAGAYANTTIENCLFAYGSLVNFYAFAKLGIVNSTIDNSQDLIAVLGSGSVSITNSLLIHVTSMGGSFTSVCNYTNSSSTGIFQTAGAGAHYLATNCPAAIQNAGTTNIDPVLLAQLQQETTHPPIIYSNTTFRVATTLSPQAQRDNMGNPNLGYHYDPIDYIADKLSITNATLTLSNGVAIASYNEAGIRLQDGSSIISTGTPLAPNWFVRYSSVQEQPISLSGTNSSGIDVLPVYTNAMPTGQYQFTKFACPANGGIHLYDYGASSYSSLTAQECEFWTGINVLGGTNSALTTLNNNLFARSVINAAGSGPLAFTNNLVWSSSSVQLNPSGSSVWYAFNNDFDSSTITNSTLTNGYNAYLNCSGFLHPTNSTDIFSTNALVYQTSWFGSFYQPTNSPLINAGSTTADQVGLYHYTTQTNQVPETNSIVDIGYHYVATDQYGNPLDTNGDGIPDYLEDSNGDGIFNAGDLGNWLIGQFNGLSMTNGLQVFTPLK